MLEDIYLRPICFCISILLGSSLSFMLQNVDKLRCGQLLTTILLLYKLALCLVKRNQYCLLFMLTCSYLTFTCQIVQIHFKADLTYNMNLKFNGKCKSGFPKLIFFFITAFLSQKISLHECLIFFVYFITIIT